MILRESKSRFAWVWVAASILVSTPAKSSEERFRHIREKILAEFEQGVTPSLAVVVSRKDEILWEEAFGWADRERGIRATPHTMYSLASVTKPMTATALMILVERGAIDLDRPMNDYLGEARLKVRVGEPQDVTVRRVANHTAGLPLHHHFFPNDEPYPRPPMAVTIGRYGNVVTEPGKRYQYSNLGYGILEHAIETVSQKTYATFMRDHVFEPLDLEHTAIVLDPKNREELAVRYDFKGESLPFYDFDHRGASAAFSCVHDLIRFGMLHLRLKAEQGCLLSDRSIKEMQKATARTNDGADYGIGWEIHSDRRGYRVVTHRGGMSGVTTSLVLIPSQKIAVAVLATSRTSLPMRVSEEILFDLLPRYARPSPRSKATIGVNSDSDIRSDPFKPPQRIVGTWAGAVHTYAGPIPLRLVVSESNGMRIRLGEQPESKLWRPMFRMNVLSGWANGDIGTADANRRRYFLFFSLELKERALSGSATAMTPSNEKLPNALSHWVELKKQPAGP